MKKLIFLLLIISITSCVKNNRTAFEPTYMGFNGQFSSVEITHYSGPDEITFKTKPLGDFMSTEVYTFDSFGYLSEKCCYADPSKQTLIAKDVYKRDKDGNLIELYSGFNLNDNHYIAETLWRMIEKDGNKERWQKIDENDWWGTSYKEIQYMDSKKETKAYVIQKKSGETSNQESITEIFNERGLMISETKDTGPNNPKNTTIRTYNDKGQLLKEEMEQLRTDGSVNKVEGTSYTIDKVDEHDNPLQVTDNSGNVKIYRYVYLK